MKNVTIHSLRIAISVLALASSREAFAVPEAEQLNLGDGRLALSGFDPVSYFDEGGPQKGEESISLDWAGVVYRFSTTENRERFRKDPESYEPAFGGWCAWAMLEGDKVEVDPRRYRIYEGELLLFYDGFWGNTLEKWKRKSESEDESKLFSQADANWKEILKK